ncbi:MAG: DUF3078 domain-containing protein [Prolixibacteraceae bacterium]|nr:DUF3078 domain-containing protein [Prolixibacteraceae bacterium]
MKKLLLILIFIPVITFAQENTEEETNWKKGGVFSANFSQVSLTNWAAGGSSSASGVFLVNTFANYKKDSLSWESSLDLGYGFLKEKDRELVKSSDKIDLNSKLGYATGKNWNYTALVNFKSQFAPGYNYPNTDSAISRFLAPAYINVALGMDYKTENLSLFISPAAGKFTIVNDEILSDAGAFGVDPGKKFRSEFGAMVKFTAKAEVLKNVTAQTKLDLFSNYFHNPQNIDVDWSVLISMKVNEYLSANLTTQMIYDDDIKILDPETGKSAPRVQFMEMFGVGLSVKF